MVSIARDLVYLTVGVEQLETYLLSKELFWPLGSSADDGRALPRLTLGGLLLAQARLETRDLTVAHQAEYARAVREIDSSRTRWRAAWGRKAARSFPSRLNQWKHYLDECQQNPQAHLAFYSQEVRIRVLLHLLEPQLDIPSSAHLTALAGLDIRLKTCFEPGEFIWDADLQPGFPKDIYWYLYGGIVEVSKPS